MYNRLLSLPLDSSDSIFLFGPRGTGKTSWLKTHLPDSLYFDLLDYSTYSSFATNPGSLREYIPKGYEKWVIIDEVQRVPEVLNEVHRLIEAEKVRFVLTGSSARRLRNKGVNLLAGRALTYYMHPLVIQEIGDTFSLQNALRYGLLPKATTSANPEKYLKTYTQTYVREEVLQEGLTRNIGAFTRFLQAASFSQGSILNIAEMGRELAVNRLVISSYFDILEDLLLAVRIQPFTYRAKRRMIAHEKFYFFDAGVYRSLRRKGPGDRHEELDGPGLETLFLQSVRALNDYLELDYTIYFWRTASGAEVDFILYGPNGFHAFELKRSDQVSNKELRGLKTFGEDYPEAILHFLYLGSHTKYHENIVIHPFVKALQELPKILKSQE